MKHNTSFTVYPDLCNYMTVNEKPCIHGGSLLLKMDRAAAECVKKLLSENFTECNLARTVGVDKVSFYCPASLGDLIEIECQVIYLGIKQIRVQVECFLYDPILKNKMADGIFSFCSFKDEQSHPHGIKL